MTTHFKHISTNGIRLHTALAGSEDGEPVFLLHGFPDAWFGWEAQIGPLADAGFRVIVPDQRGYNLSDKPNGVANCKWQTLKIPIPAASSGALRNFAPSGTGLLAYFIWASPSGTLGSGHSSHQQAGGYSGI